MNNTKHSFSNWNQKKEQERFVYRLIIFAIVTGMTGGILLIISILKFYQALTDGGKL